MNSLRSVLALRAFLWEQNTARESEGKILLRMNSAVQVGNVLAGRILIPGISEYAVAGDILNEAMKCEGLCNSAGVDIAIAENVRDLAGSRILAENITVPKSIKNGVKYYGLVNLAPSNDGEKQRWPFNLNDVRDSLATRKEFQKKETTE
jgi:class 3 adenylate cyclase